MDYARILASLEKDVTAWCKSQSIRLVLEDRPFTEAENETKFVRHSVVFGDGEPTSLGAMCFRYVGLHYVSIMYRPGEGLNSIYKLVDSAVKRYSEVTIDGRVVMRTASVVKRPKDGKGIAQMQVVCPFYFDITRS